MEIVRFTNISNHCHDSRNYGSGSRSFSKFTGMVENVGFANIVHKYMFQNGVTEICGWADLTYSCEVFCKQGR